MKKFVFLLFALFALTAVASATPSLTTSESYYLELINYDSAGVTPIPPESVYVVVFDQDGDSVYTATMDTSNAQCKGPYTRSYRSGVTVKTYTYYNTVGTLDGTTGGNGHYVVSAFVWNTTKDVSWYVTGDFYEVSTSFATFMDSTLNASRDDMSDKKITPTDTTNTGQQVYAEASPLEELIAYQGVATGTPSTTKFAATGLTQADNYWNGALVFFKNGNAQNQPRPVSDFFDTGDSITISSAWTAAPTAGDSFYIVNIAASSGGGASALDFWNVAFGTAFTAGSMGDSMNNASYMQGGASGLDSAALSRIVGRKVWGIAAGTGSDSSLAADRGVDMMYVSDDGTAANNFETMLDGTGGQRLTLSQLRVVANTTDDTAIVAIGADNGMGMALVGAGTGYGVQASSSGSGGGASWDGRSGAPGMRIRSADASGIGLYVQGGSASGDAVQIASVSGDGIQIESQAAGDAIKATAAAGDGFEATSTSGGVDFNATLNFDDITGTAASAVFETGYFDAFWDRPFGTGWTAGSMGDSLNNASYMQGTASGLSAHDIWTYRIDTMAVEATGEDAAEALNGTLDTLQLLDGWMAQQATLTGTLTANMTQISGDATAADNFETMLDGTGGQALTLGNMIVNRASAGAAVTIVAANGDGINAAGGGSGRGAAFTGGATGAGLSAFGGATSGDGIYIAAINGDGIQADAGTNGYGITAAGAGSAYGIWAYSAGTGGGIQAQGRSGAPGLRISGADASGVGMYVQGGTGSGDAIQITSASGDGIQIESQAAGDGVKTTAAAGDGFEMTSTSGGFDLNATLNLDDLTGTAASGAFETGYFDAFWNRPFNTAWTGGSMGDSLNNASYVQGTASGLTATQVADTVWKSLMSARSGVAGSFGDSALDWGRSGSAGSTPWDIWTFRIDTMAVEGTGEDAAEALNGSLDSLQVLEAWVAQQAEVSNLNGGTLLSVTDNIGVNLDDISGTLSGTEIALTQAEFTPDYSVLAVTDNIGINLDDASGVLSGTEIALTQSEFTPDYSTLAAADNIGLNLDDVTGALSTADFDDNIWTASKIAAGAITSSEAPNLDVAVSSRGTMSTLDAATLDDAATDEIWEYAVANITTVGGIGKALRDTQNVQTGLLRYDVAVSGGLVAGYCDSITQLYYPLTGAGNKDSVVFTRWAAGSPIRLMVWVYGNNILDGSVADTMTVVPNGGGSRP